MSHSNLQAQQKMVLFVGYPLRTKANSNRVKKSTSHLQLACVLAINLLSARLDRSIDH